jgi:hypothetical protein
MFHFSSARNFMIYQRYSDVLLYILGRFRLLTNRKEDLSKVTTSGQMLLGIAATNSTNFFPISRRACSLLPRTPQNVSPMQLHSTPLAHSMLQVDRFRFPTLTMRSRGQRKAFLPIYILFSILLTNEYCSTIDGSNVP